MRKLKPEELKELAPKIEVGSIALPYKRDDGLTPALNHVLKEVQRELGLVDSSAEGADESAENESRERSEKEVLEIVRLVSSRNGLELSRYEIDQILSQLNRESRPFGVLQELVDSHEVSDIIVTHYSDISFQTSRKTHPTDIRFSSQEAYEAFVERVLLKAGTTYSTKKPVADGMIGSFARVHAVHKSICESGPYLTIRLNRFSSVTSKDLLLAGLAPEPIFDYLSCLIQEGCTMLIVGEVGTGKTTLARALAGNIPETESILVIEDTPEIRLEHPETRYISTREANMDGEGRISPAYCIRAGMRMAMNRIIFGEIRDAEAAEAFIDVCSSGHPGLSTIHARSASDALTRLELFLGRSQRGVSKDVVNQQISTAVELIVYLGICKQSGRRRVLHIKEVGAAADGVLRSRDMFKYESSDGVPKWNVISRASQHQNWLENSTPPVKLSSMPSFLELPVDVVFRERADRAA